MLAEQVAAGTLPPVAERLPEEPMVVEPFESVGAVRRHLAAGDELAQRHHHPGAHHRLRELHPLGDLDAGPEQTDIVPDVVMNVAESVDVNEDGSEYTFHLRPGHEVVATARPTPPTTSCSGTRTSTRTPKLFPAKPTWSVRNDTPLVVEKIDDYTVTFNFGGPNGAAAAGTWRRRPTTSSRTCRPPIRAHYLRAVPPEVQPERRSRRRRPPAARAGCSASTPRPTPGAIPTCRGSTPGSSPRASARAPATRSSPSATPTTSRSTPRGTSCPTSTT